jgi:hypothetical protein
MIEPIKLDKKLGNKSDSNKNAESGDGEDTELNVADLAQEDDMWKIAEYQLRQDKTRNDLLDAYYDS